MRKLGCLTLIVLLGLGVYLLVSTRDMTEQERSRWIGQKVHRGWNRMRKLARSAKEGWNSVDERDRDRGREPAE